MLAERISMDVGLGGDDEERKMAPGGYKIAYGNVCFLKKFKSSQSHIINLN